MNMDSMNKQRKLYEAPTLEAWGQVTDLTQASWSRPGSDGCFHQNVGHQGSLDRFCPPGGPFVPVP